MSIKISMSAICESNPYMFGAGQFARAARTIADQLHDTLRLAIAHEVENAALPQLPDEPPEEIQEATYELVHDLIYSPPASDGMLLARGVIQIVDLWKSMQPANTA
jgi:hypothetical protein